MGRHFFALWPDEEAAARLAALARELAPAASGKPVPQSKIHLTLAFLGALPPQRMRAAREAGDAVRSPAFELAFDRVGCFRAAGVGWAGLHEDNAALAALQSRLAAQLRRRGFELEERRFTPHLTLVRRAGRSIARAPVEPVAWTVDAFRLVRSDLASGQYSTLAEWALAGRRAEAKGKSRGD